MFNLKNSPVLNAINAKAISERNSVPFTTVFGTASRQKGPKRIPVIIYAVTFGSFKSFVSRVMAKPQNSIRAMVIIAIAAGDCIPKVFCIKSAITSSIF